MRGLSDLRTVVASNGKAPNSVRTVENRGLDRLLRTFIFVHRGDPGVQLGARKANQTAGRIQPHRMGVVVHRPMNGIARQSIFAGKRGNMPVFQPAETALSGRPQRTVPIGSQVVDTTVAQPVSGSIRCPNPTIREIRNATLEKSKP